MKVEGNKSKTLLFRRTYFCLPVSSRSSKTQRSTGSLCSAAARDPESVRAEIGPAEAGERDPRRERARNEGRGPEIGGERIPV